MSFETKVAIQSEADIRSRQDAATGRASGPKAATAQILYRDRL
jgi:hypothetical protein